MAIRGGGLTLPASSCRVIVMVNEGDPASVEQLVSVQVKLFGVPHPYRYVDVCSWEQGSWDGHWR
jgi:hypothetical protein